MHLPFNVLSALVQEPDAHTQMHRPIPEALASLACPAGPSSLALWEIYAHEKAARSIRAARHRCGSWSWGVPRLIACLMQILRHDTVPDLFS